MLCRYTNKDSAFVQVHRSSEPFKAIKQLAAQHGCEPISSTGQGWTEQVILPCRLHVSLSLMLLCLSVRTPACQLTSPV